MANKENITPEEKLLKIIENPATAQKRKALPDIKSTAGALTDWIKRLLPGGEGKEAFRVDMRTINKALAVICVCVTLYAVIYLITEGSDLSRKFSKIISGGNIQAVREKAPPEAAVKTEELVAGVNQRNIFTLAPKEKPIERADLSGGAVELKLVGILWSDTPQAMIEDTKDQKTYLVSKGDKIGSVSVKDILVNKVVLTKDQQEWDLR